MNTETKISHAHNDIFIDLFNDSLLKNKGVGYDCMNYINNWELLMNLTEKIESIGYQVDFGSRVLPDKSGKDSFCVIWNDEHTVKIFESGADTKKEALYLGCLGFCKWFIETKQQEILDKIKEDGIEWKCTDPDNEQYGRQISERVFEFKEKNRYSIYNDDDDIIQITINLDNYTAEQIEDHISAYYQGMEQLKELYGDESTDWIIAECIFEQESGIY